MYTEEEVKYLCLELAEDIKVIEGDLEVSEDGLSATIPYYAHGRMSSHQIDLEMMARTALIFARTKGTHQ